jgi:tRNA A37 methylthiotransferase MiaB
LDRLLKKGQEEKEKYLTKQVGKTFTVAVESYKDGYTEGYTENYVRAYIKGRAESGLVRVKITGLYKDGVTAEEIK